MFCFCFPCCDLVGVIVARPGVFQSEVGREKEKMYNYCKNYNYREVFLWRYQSMKGILGGL